MQVATTLSLARQVSPHGHGPALRPLVFVLPLLLGLLSACSLLSHERLIYDEGGAEIGLEHDPSTRNSAPTVLNSHPARLTKDQIQILLGSIQVSGWTGMIGGILRDPPVIPLFSEEELRRFSRPLAEALTHAGPEERVFFSTRSLTAPYSPDPTAGSLFVRGPYLHLTLQDHSALLRTDTAGGEDYKDLRDFKGMHLWVLRPAKAATLSPQEQPAWGPFEKIHISLNVQEVLAARSSSPAAVQILSPPQRQAPPQQPAPLPPPQTQPAQAGAAAQAPAAPAEDLHPLLRELATSNQELRSKLKEQAEDMQALKDELARLKQELTNSKPKAKPRSKPSPP